MFYLSINDRIIDASSMQSVGERIFEFNIEKQDYFLRFFASWDMIETTIYKFSIGNTVFCIPSGFYILIGDELGTTDWIVVDEVLGRNIDSIVLSKDMQMWNLGEIKLLDSFQGQYYYPYSKNAIPIVSKDKIVLISQKDQYTRTKSELVNIYTM